LQNINKLKIGGLCSGVGGMELGFKKAGFEIVWANDMDKNCMLTYEAILGKNHYIGEGSYTIREIINNDHLLKNISYADVVTAGFPCQAFSIAGERKGFEDARGTVIYDILDFIKKMNKPPKVILLENVKNLKTHDNGNTYDIIEKHIYDMGYSVYTKILNSCDFSPVPQNRERTYIICFKGEENWKKFRFHEKHDFISSKEFKNAIEKCPKTSTFHLNFPNRHTRANLVKIKSLLENNKIDDKYYYNETNYPKFYTMLNKELRDNRSVFQIRRVYTRKNENDLCPTLTANMGTGGHNVPIVSLNGKKNKKIWRKLTPKECFRFQGFNETELKNIYKINSNAQLYKQAGNSVTVPVIQKLAKAISLSLSNT